MRGFVSTVRLARGIVRCCPSDIKANRTARNGCPDSGRSSAKAAGHLDLDADCSHRSAP
jgi:hypothetical protein